MPETKRPLKVFLSYASQDRPLVRELSRRLVGEGWIDTWVDEKSLLPGQDWRVKIEEAVEEADVVIICLSNHSVSKEGHVQKELRYAREIALEKPEETIFLIPLRLDECEVPRGLRFYQWVDYFGDAKDNSYDALVKSLKLRYEQKLKLEELEQARKEKTRLEAEELDRKKVEKEKAEREDAEKAAQEKLEKEIQRKLEKSIKKAKRDLWWENFKIDINYRLRLIRIYRVPILILLVALAIMIPLSLDLVSKISKSPQTLNSTPIFTVSLTKLIVPSRTSNPVLKPTETFLPSKTPAASVTPTLITFPAEITDAKGVQMVLVPAGEFIMGTDLADNPSYPWYVSGPAHKVFLSDYYIDKYEVTNALYKKCVDTGVCQPPQKTSSNTHPNYYGNPRYDNHPVIYVNWNMAKVFCEWRSASLPTEAQWEKAARDTDGRIYPWGNSRNGSGNYSGDDTIWVGYYESGKSPYGIYDMEGNVTEWVMDWYSATYYQNSPYENPLGPTIGEEHVLRGSSWNNYIGAWPVYKHTTASESYSASSVGFRCAYDVIP